MKAYRWDTRARAYAVKDYTGNTVYRRTRTAAGMTATGARQGKHSGGDALTLSVKGTLAKGSALAYRTRAVQGKWCPCCGERVRKLALNDSGRRELRYRRERAHTAAARRDK